jgi:hypothetical protein
MSPCRSIGAAGQPENEMSDFAATNMATAPPRSGVAKTYIAVTFWGEEYRQYFLNYCLATLMAPNNVPAISNKNAARLLLATRRDDWETLQSEPIFVTAKQHIAVDHLTHDAPLHAGHETKMSVMSQGHKLLARRMFEDRAHGIIVYPDMLLADGAIRRIEQLAANGYRRCSEYPSGLPMKVSSRR